MSDSKVGMFVSGSNQDQVLSSFACSFKQLLGDIVDARLSQGWDAAESGDHPQSAIHLQCRLCLTSKRKQQLS